MAPLLQPAECCVLLVDPRKQHISHLGDFAQQRLSSSLMLLGKAVHTARIPAHLAFVAAVPEPGSLVLAALVAVGVFLRRCGHDAQPK